MQGKYGSENALPLNELLTVVLISHNRPAFLRRAVQFYSTLPCKVLVLDSSAELTDGVAGRFASVEYQHLPQYGYWGIQRKLDYGVRQITTPYMVFVSDDDFILHSALTDSVDFLYANPDYGMCHGYCLMYLALGKSVNYYRRDKKVSGDYGAELPQDRIVDFLGEYIPPFYAVSRTDLVVGWYDAMPPETSFQWQEIGHSYYMLACAKARVLPIPYVVREINYAVSEHGTEILHTLVFPDKKYVAEREAFASVLAGIPTSLQIDDFEERRQMAFKAFAALAHCLMDGRSLTNELIIDSTWVTPGEEPTRRFGPKQYMEMPFYNETFFNELTKIEFFLHCMPAGRLQLAALEGVWARQEQLLVTHDNDVAETVTSRLWDAMQLNIFNRRVVRELLQRLSVSDKHNDLQMIQLWDKRLNSFSQFDNRTLYSTMRSGRLVKWLEARTPDADEQRAIAGHLSAHGGGPQFGLLLLDLDNDMVKLQATLDSLVEGQYRNFKIVVFTTGEPPAATTSDNTLHFVKVTQGNYVDKLNLSVRQLGSEWLVLADAGDQFTQGGLLQASLELLSAPQCRAVCADEIHRKYNGALADVFRPDFNLDLLQSLPTLMARHWLIRRDVLLEAGGYSTEFENALEFDLLLRIIEQGGMAWLAHMSEPLLICDALALEENNHERQALSRHLMARGYKAKITSESAGTWQIDYRHTERPLVSILIHGTSEPAQLQRCVTSVLQRTRYTKFELLIAETADVTPETLDWLASQQQPVGRIRLIKIEEALSASGLINRLAGEAKGEYLVLLDAEGEVVSPNWIGLLLNQALRPEVAVVGGKLLDVDSKVTQAGLILGMNEGVGSAFVGEAKDAPGYMQRLILTQNYSAVSATCMMIRKALFDAVEGFDEEVFAQAYGDVDLCLKVGQAGYLTVWTPQAQVTHPGILPDAQLALAALRDKWAGAFESDPAYNKNLTLTGEGFEFGSPSSVNWLQLLA